LKDPHPRQRGLLADIAHRIQWKMLMLMPNERRIEVLRRHGVQIGENCLIFTTLFSTEPYLIRIGNHVAVSSGTSFITHDASGWVFQDHPDMDLFGRIEVRDNTFIGTDCTILPGARIGSNCIVGSGSVIRGVVPDDSVVMGNPARIVMKTSLARPLLVHHRHRLDTRRMTRREKDKLIRQHFELG
jgi:acetyltransferase-like isoleucine patch superfamily enzyme